MKFKSAISTVAFLIVTILSTAQEITPTEVRSVMKKVADWQIDHYRDAYTDKEPHHPLDWTNGALYVEW